MSVPLLGDVVPEGLRTVCVLVEVAGQLFPEGSTERWRAPEAGDTYDFAWNGRNAFERALQGAQVARVWLGYGFEAALRGGISLETPDGADALGLPDALLWSRQDVPLGLLDAQGYQFGGFGFDVQHDYDPVSETVYFGDGTERHADALHLMVVAMDQADPGSTKSSDPSSHMIAPDSVAVAADGSALVTDDAKDKARVWRMASDGSYETLLGEGASGDAGEVEIQGPQGIATDPTDGTIYVVDWERLAVWRLRSGGQLDILLGDDPSAAIQHPLENPDGLTVGSNHELYVADANKVWKGHPNQARIEETPCVGG